MPASGPNGWLPVTAAPEMYSWTLAPRRLDVAKSIPAACDRATLVTSDVGSRLATPAKPASAPPPDTPSRFSRIAALSSANRSPGAIGPAGAENRVGENELPPMARSLRVLTTKLVLSVRSGTPRSSW